MKQIEEENDEPRTKVEELVEEILDEKMIERKVLVGARLKKNKKEKLVEFLKNNQDVFAWSHKDMLGIDSTYMCHELNINPNYPVVKQKPRHFSPGEE